MPSKQPVNLNLMTIRMPVTALVSIGHRLSGLLTFLLIPVLLCALSLSLKSEEGYAQLMQYFDGLIFKAIVWAGVLGLGYHLIAGVRHLLMDLHIGETNRGGKLGAWIVLALFIAFSAVITFRMWG